MTTEDIVIPRTGEYVLIEIVTTQMIITNTSDGVIFLRFGSTSTSQGIPLEVNESAIVDSDVYIAWGGLHQPGLTDSVVVTR